MVKIRRVIPFKYADQLKALQLHCFTRAVDLIPLDEGFWWVGTVEGDIVVAYACMKPSIIFENTGYFSRAGVHKNYRGQGLQDKLIKARIEFAKQAGYEFVSTDTTGNPQSANNLINNGFKTHSVTGWTAQTIVWYKDLKRKITTTGIKPKVKKT